VSSASNPARASELIDPLVGKRLLGRYLVEALLGRGGQCAVFRVVDAQRDERLAMKVLAPQLAHIPDARARFQREASCGTRISHPNVAKVFVVGELEDGAPYFVMELLEGPALGSVLENGPIPLRRTIEIGGQILAGLGAAHALGIAHRDIKPDNIMLARNGRRDVVKIVDFGIAADEHAVRKLTMPGIAFGTPQYLSPEMAMGLPADARSDVYSVAVVLFEMVTGRLPFEGESLQSLLAAHTTQAPPPPSRIAPFAKLPAAFDELVARAMSKGPSDRFQTAEEMRAALLACDPGTQGRRLAWVSFSIVALAVLTLVGFWWSSRQQAPVTAEEPVASPAKTPPPKVTKAPKKRRHAR
jgi:eukaryotic-like serine/threonine-protein kinase